MFKKLKSWVGKTLNQIGKALKGTKESQQDFTKLTHRPAPTTPEGFYRRGKHSRQGMGASRPSLVNRLLRDKQYHKLKSMGFNLVPTSKS